MQLWHAKSDLWKCGQQTRFLTISAKTGHTTANLKQSKRSKVTEVESKRNQKTFLGQQAISQNTAFTLLDLFVKQRWRGTKQEGLD